MVEILSFLEIKWSFLWCEVFLWNKFKTRWVDAVTLTCATPALRRPIAENMTKMNIIDVTTYFCSREAHTEIFGLSYYIRLTIHLGCRLSKTWPPSATIKLMLTTEEDLFTCHRLVQTRPLIVVIWISERWLCPMLICNSELQRSQLVLVLLSEGTRSMLRECATHNLFLFYLNTD